MNHNLFKRVKDMKCPKCSSTHSRVVDSRHADDANAIRRKENAKIVVLDLRRSNI